jgi:hypothetical protein
MPPRKKPVVVETVVVTVADTNGNSAAASAADTSVAAEKPKKTREKKSTKHKVVAVVTPEGIHGNFQAEVRRPLIAHLNIRTSEIQFHDQPIAYDPNPPPQPVAFNAGDIDPFAEEATYENAPDMNGGSPVAAAAAPAANKMTHTFDDGEEDDVHQPVEVVTSVKKATATNTNTGVQQPAPRREYGPTKLLVQYASSHQSCELPAHTDLACFWCCEMFEGRPCVIPSEIIDDMWHVYGSFCTPQCGMAYLLSELLDTHTRWERIALLNRLYGAQTNGRVYPAPSRETLQRFGGPISSADFRGMCEQQRVRVDIALPPMVSILASMDTKPIDFYETPLRNTFASPHALQIQRQAEEPTGLKLRRTKPLKDKESTLDNVLNITIR